MSGIDLSHVDKVVEEIGRGRDAVIPILQAIQSHYRYLPQEALERVCQISEITPATITGVSTFYMQFRHEPVGKHVVHVCHGTACHVKGSGLVHEAIHNHLEIREGQKTDEGGNFTVQKVACLGCCTLAPVLEIDGSTYGHLTPRKVPAVIEDFLRPRKTGGWNGVPNGDGGTREGYAEIRIGLGSCCVAGGSARVQEVLERTVARTGARAVVKRVGCVGMCHRTPLVQVVTADAPAAFYAGVEPEAARDIVLRHFRPKGIVRKVLYSTARAVRSFLADPEDDRIERHSMDVRDPHVSAFIDKQVHIATEHCGELDPLDLQEYIERDGFKALRRVVKEMDPEATIDAIKASGLRGRGGAGFPTGVKWEKVRGTGDVEKFVICNGDEGDPGAFMDRMLMESYPYRVIEGLAIAAWAVGAKEGYLYIRAEYPLAVRRIREAIRRLGERGILGDSVMGSGRPLHLKIFEGAGAFVCGEETALIASIEGDRGMPRLRPPYPAEEGLRDRPTLINNVETYALVPWIIRNGAARFAALGTRTSKGTKVFALSGRVARGGLIEVPMGITLREIVEGIGGGVAAGGRFKAVQVGGPSGGCVPEALADTPVDYEALAGVGAIMGSGGLVVLDDTTCMVDIARYFLEFTQDQSCGKCTYCRVGTRRMLEILTRICEGHGRKGDIELLEDLSRMVKDGSLCGLGKTAPNPVLTTIRYFREEYEAHLAKRCSARKCKALISYSITDACTGCTLCAQHCPADAIPLRPYTRHEIDPIKCTRCNTCAEVCPAGAVHVE
jgi:NADH-quinone oxidoreductase subunit F